MLSSSGENTTSCCCSRIRRRRRNRRFGAVPPAKCVARPAGIGHGGLAAIPRRASVREVPPAHPRKVWRLSAWRHATPARPGSAAPSSAGSWHLLRRPPCTSPQPARAPPRPRGSGPIVGRAALATRQRPRRARSLASPSSGAPTGRSAQQGGSAVEPCSRGGNLWAGTATWQSASRGYSGKVDKRKIARFI